MVSNKLNGWYYWHAPGAIHTGCFRHYNAVTYFEASRDVPYTYTEAVPRNKWGLTIGINFLRAKHGETIVLSLDNEQWELSKHPKGVLMRRV